MSKARQNKNVVGMGAALGGTVLACVGGLLQILAWANGRTCPEFAAWGLLLVVVAYLQRITAAVEANV